MVTSPQRIVITGAGGFIGSHLTEVAAALPNVAVRVLLRYSSEQRLGCLGQLPPDLLSRIEIVRGDLRNLDLVQNLIGPGDIVFHLGALISVPYSYMDPLACVDVNVAGTAHVLDACRRAGVRRVVVMSTAEVYGTAQYLPIDEQHPLCAQSPYAATKIAAEKLAESYWLSYSLPVTVVRPFNNYGPRQSDRAVIPSIIKQALAGSEVRLGYVDSTRDFLYVADTVQALLTIAQHPDACGKVLNIATGVGTSVREVVGIVGELIGRKLTIVTAEERLRPEASEVRRHTGNASALERITGWQPTTPLPQGLMATIEWISRHQDHQLAYRV